MSEPKIMSIPVIKLTNPIDSLDVNDMTTLDDAAIVLETLIGSCLAHQDCGPGCGLYQKSMVDKLMLMHHALDELAEAVANATGADREPADEARAAKRSEQIYRKVSKLQGKSDAEIEEELIELSLADEIDEASRSMEPGTAERVDISLRRDRQGKLDKRVDRVVDMTRQIRGDQSEARSVDDIIDEIMSGKPQRVQTPRRLPKRERQERVYSPPPAEVAMDKKYNA